MSIENSTPFNLSEHDDAGGSKKHDLFAEAKLRGRELAEYAERLSQETESLGRVTWEYLYQLFDNVVEDYRRQGKSLQEARDNSWWVVTGFVFSRMLAHISTDMSEFDTAQVTNIREEASTLQSWMDLEKEYLSDDLHHRGVPPKDP